MTARRSRLLVLTAVAATTLGGVATADAQPNGGQVTIHSAPNPVTAGDPVVVFGRAPAGSEVVLWHRINPQQTFSPISHTTANSSGQYEFERPDGVVVSNRNWYAVADNHRSRVVHEKVRALLTLAGPTNTNVDTGVPTAFTGTVTPAHGGDTLVLQRQNASGDLDHWNRIDRTTINGDGSYAFNHKFRHPGDANIRVLLRADRVNIKSPSNVLSLQIEQAQNPNLTIASSANPINEGDSVTVSGTLANTTTPQPVTLYAKTFRRGFSPIASSTTDATGNYSFAQTPVVNTFYKVKSSHKVSAILFEGVKAVVTAAADQTDVVAGTKITFSGSVSPDETGHYVYLQRRNANGQDWHVIASARVKAGSAYALHHRVNYPGSPVFRVLFAGGPVIQRGVSDPITVNVSQNPTPITQ